MKTSCISHRPRKKLLMIRETYLQSCGGDHCAAALLAVFEYWHNVKIEQSSQESEWARSNPNYKPNFSLWVFKSTADLCEDILGLYAASAVQKAISDLVFRGFIRKRFNPDNPLDRTPMYLFIPKNVQKCLDNAPKEGDWSPSESDDAFSGKNESSSSNQAVSLEEITPTETTVELSVGSPPESLIDPETVLARWTHHRGFQKPKKTERLRAIEKLQKFQFTEATCAAALDGFHASDYARTEGYPLFLFLKKPFSWVEELSGQQRTSPTVEHHTIPSGFVSKVPPPQESQDGPIPDLLGIWNATVPDAPCENDFYAPRKEIAACVADPAFTVEKFTESAKIAQKILTVRGSDAWWVTLRWALTRKDGKPPGWHQLLNGMRKMGDPPQGKPKSENQSRIDRLAQEAKERELARAAKRAAREATA